MIMAPKNYEDSLITKEQHAVPVKLVAALLLYSVHHDRPWTDDWSIYVDGQYPHPFENMRCTHHNRGKPHNANLDQLQCQGDIYYM